MLVGFTLFSWAWCRFWQTVFTFQKSGPWCRKGSSNPLTNASCARNWLVYFKEHVLADVNRLGIDQIQNRIRKLRIRPYLFCEMLRLYCFIIVNFHRQVIILDPFLRNTFKLACLGILDNPDTRNRMQRLPFIKLLPLFRRKLVNIKRLWILTTHEQIKDK